MNPQLMQASSRVPEVLKSLCLLVLILVGLLMVVGLATNIKFSDLTGVVQNILTNPDKVARVLMASIPLWLTALAFSVPLKAGFFNVGADGQLALGTLGAAVTLLALPAMLSADSVANAVVLGLVVPLIAGGAGGAWIGVALLLRRRFGVHEVVSTLLLNFVSFGIIGVALRVAPGLGDWTGGSQGLKTVAFPDGIVQFAQVLSFKGATLTLYAFYSFGLLLSAHFVLWHTHPGLRLRAAGMSRQVADFAGIDTKRLISWGALIGGGLAGLAGLNQLLSAERFDLAHYQALGFEGIAVALLGRHRLGGIISVALLLCLWRHLTNDLQRLGMPAQLYWVGQGLAMIAFLGLVRRSAS